MHFKKPDNWFKVLCPLFIALVGSLMIVSFSDETVNFEEMALGSNNVAVYSNVQGYPIHCGDISNANKCVDSFYSMEGENAIIWLGNSQLHAINQFESGQQTMSSILYHLLKEKRNSLITFSQPNANLQEHYLIYQYLKTKISFSSLILPVVFDDMRETGLREGVKIAFDEVLVIEEIQNSAYGNEFVNSYKKNEVITTESWHSIQDKSENLLTTWLGEHSTLWANREHFRGSIFYKLYDIRNFIFRIKANSKRKMIKGHFEKNFNALKEILADAKRNNIDVYLYIPPIRNDVEMPYIISEYENFKKSVEISAEKYEANYENFESIVPGKYWGYVRLGGPNKESELDFMHFQSKGHEILAQNLFNFLKK